jgi:hypothetical protein
VDLVPTIFVFPYDTVVDGLRRGSEVTDLVLINNTHLLSGRSSTTTQHTHTHYTNHLSRRLGGREMEAKEIKINVVTEVFDVYKEIEIFAVYK